MDRLVALYKDCWDSWPGSAKWCMRFTYAQIMSSLAGHLCFVVGPKFEATTNLAEIEIFGIARYVLVIPLGLLVLYHFYESAKPSPNYTALTMARISIFEFSMKIVYYTTMATNAGLVLQNVRCYDLRPIYLARWYGWTFVIPTLLCMNYRPMLDDRSFAHVIKRICPQQAATAGPWAQLARSCSKYFFSLVVM